MIVKIDRTTDYVTLVSSVIEQQNSKQTQKHENIFCNYQFAKGIWN